LKFAPGFSRLIFLAIGVKDVDFQTGGGVFPKPAVQDRNLNQLVTTSRDMISITQDRTP
jgi:hypothetical protein